MARAAADCEKCPAETAALRLNLKTRQLHREALACGYAAAEKAATPNQEIVCARLPEPASGLAENLFSEIGGDGNAETFALVGLHHQKNPSDKDDEVQKRKQCPPEAERAEATEAEHPDSQNQAQNEVENVQAAEQGDRLARVETDERALIDQKKDKPGDPAEDVTQQACDVFREARLRYGGGHGCCAGRRHGRGRRRGRAGDRLRGATRRTERSACID